jgi:hypothetical protein
MSFFSIATISMVWSGLAELPEPASVIPVGSWLSQ